MDSTASTVEPSRCSTTDLERLRPLGKKPDVVRGRNKRILVAAVIVPLSVIPLIMIPHCIVVVDHWKGHFCPTRSLGWSSMILQIFLALATAFFAIMTSKGYSVSPSKYAITAQVVSCFVFLIGIAYFAPAHPLIGWKFTIDMLDAGCAVHEMKPKDRVADHARLATSVVLLMVGGIALSILSIVLLYCLRRDVKRALSQANKISFEPPSSTSGTKKETSDKW